MLSSCSNFALIASAIAQRFDIILKGQYGLIFFNDMKWSLSCHLMVPQFQFKDMNRYLPCVFIPHFVIYISAISVNKQKTPAYCIVTRIHIDRSHGPAVTYIHKWHEAGNRWVHVYWKYIIKSMRLTHWLIICPFIVYDVIYIYWFIYFNYIQI